MLDPGILLFLQNAPLPPEPPLMVHERVWLSDAGVAAERRGRKYVESYRSYADSWAQKIRELKLRAPQYDWASIPAEQQKALDNLIADVEELADARALLSVRLEKRTRQDIKRMFQREPSVAAAMRSVASGLIAVDREIIELLLEQALFLRSLRAESRAEAHTGASFDDPAALEGFLERALG